MKLGVHYNLFDGSELLEFSIRSIRDCASYVCVIYQDVSNFGNQSKVDLKHLLDDLKSKGLIDEYVKHEPIIGRGHQNEITKRQKGLDLCRKNGCSHHMTMDCDEFYKKEELLNTMSIIESDGYDTTACQMQTYYKTPEWALDPPETYYVPLIYKIDERRFEMSKQWPVTADPTRKMLPKKFMAFTRNIIEMHHFSYVRSDIRSKLINSSASVNFKHRIEEIASYHDNWTSIKMAMLAGKEERLYDIRRTTNYFGISI